MANKNEQPLLRAYLVTGTDELKRETVVKRLHQRVAKEGDLSFNFEQFNGESAEGAAIVAACNTLPFASNVRLVQVDAADKLKKADQEAVIAYLGSPNETTVLALTTTGLAKNTRLYKAVAAQGAQAVIDCSPVKRKELPTQVRNMAMTHGVTITPSAANMLVDLIGENTVALDSMLQKIALAHAGNDPINDAEVIAHVPRTAQAKPWEFVDAFSARNIAKCTVLRTRMPSTTPHALMAMCTTRIRELIIAQSLDGRGRLGDLPAKLGVPDWRVRNHGMWARGFTSRELREALLSARDTEKAMKSGKDPEGSFTDWYLSVLAR